MILIGQFDSPFVRRVGIALTLYDIPFEHRPWSVFGDTDKVREFNPLVRVPVLVLDDGEAIVESHAMLDHLDSLVPEDRALFPRGEPERRRAIRIANLATGLSDKAVSLFYELRLHDSGKASEVWANRCRMQLSGALEALETDRAKRPSAYWFGDRFGHADIAVACSLRHLNESFPALVSMDDHPALRSHCARMESLPVFHQIQQPFIPPA